MFHSLNNVKNIEINQLSQKKKDQFRANNIGVIFQQFNFLDYLSPIQNILLPCFFTQFNKHDKEYFYNRTFDLAEKLNIKKNILYHFLLNNFSFSFEPSDRYLITDDFISGCEYINVLGTHTL